MTPLSISLLTVCGLDELHEHGTRRVTHVLSILDPGWPDPEAFLAFDPHHRTRLHFHDAVAPAPGIALPQRAHVAQILEFGRGLAQDAASRDEGHLLVHCHAGISRSTAAMAMLLAQVYPDQAEDTILERLVAIRPQAWPNLRMIGFADEALGRDGRLTAAVGRLYKRRLHDRPELAETMQRLNRGEEIALAEIS